MIFLEMAPYFISSFVFKYEKIYRGQKGAANHELPVLIIHCVV